MDKPFDNTLFLDRDGVINVHLPGRYVTSVEKFRFTLGAQHALRLLSKVFRHIIVVTNQRGVGKGMMSEADLAAIHAFMCNAIEKSGGRIDRVYVCTATDDAHPDRKPNAGMALAAVRDFPDIDLSRSVMLGDSPSDMAFAKAAGMKGLLINSTPEADYPSLIDFAENWTGNIVK